VPYIASLNARGQAEPVGHLRQQHRAHVRHDPGAVRRHHRVHPRACSLHVESAFRSGILDLRQPIFPYRTGTFAISHTERSKDHATVRLAGGARTTP
jgi:hypothetical protein